MSNTLQPISSECGGSNELGNSSIGVAILTKRTNATPSEENKTGVNKNTDHTEHSDSALVASYIQEVND